MQRLAALVPRPRLHLIRFHGVLAPNAQLRSAIIPQTSETTTSRPDNSDATTPRSTSARIGWAQLLKRVFNIDVSLCPHCGGPLKIIAAIQNPSAIARILGHLGLPTRAPQKAPARAFDYFATA